MLDSTTVTCPYCGEAIDLAIDVSAGSQSYISDCSVCCRPIEVSVSVEADGGFDVTVRTGDD